MAPLRAALLAAAGLARAAALQLARGDLGLVAGAAREAGCGSWLVLEYSNASAGGEAPSALYYPSWPPQELLVWRRAGGCVQSYRTSCREAGMSIEEHCGSSAPASSTVEAPAVCAGGLACASKARRLDLAEGDHVTVRTPAAGQVLLTSGYLRYYSVLAAPAAAAEPEELAAVAAWASRLAGGGPPGEVAARRIREEPSQAPQTLLQLAEAAREANDGKDQDAQILYHLLTLLFQDRRVRFALLPAQLAAPWVIRDLSETLSSLEQLRARMSEAGHGTAGNPGSELSYLDAQTDFGLYSTFAHYYNGLAARTRKASPDARTALIFTCSYGNGHKSAAAALKGIFRDGGIVADIVDTTNSAGFVDLQNQARALAFNELILRRQSYLLGNVMHRIDELQGPTQKPCPSPICNSRRKQQFRGAILDSRPDILVTVYHFDLVATLEVAKDLGNLPVLHLATDIDIKMREVFRVAPSYPRFLAGMPFDLAASRQTTALLDSQHIFVSGYAVRGEFLVPANATQVALDRASTVPAGTQVLLIMSGGAGQDVPWPYQLASLGIGRPLHIIVVAGGNAEVAVRLRMALPFSVVFPDGRVVWQGLDKSVTVEVAADPKAGRPLVVSAGRLVSLMDIADAVLTKPGGGSTAEVAYRGAPVVFDTSRSPLQWERFTVEVFESQGRGLAFSNQLEFRSTLLRAMALGRSTRLAEGSNGQILDTRKRVLDAATRLFATECVRCTVFP